MKGFEPLGDEAAARLHTTDVLCDMGIERCLAEKLANETYDFLDPMQKKLQALADGNTPLEHLKLCLVIIGVSRLTGEASIWASITFPIVAELIATMEPNRT